jgi:ceramide glucosyltransferase
VRHQLRWARSVRDSRRWGYVGLGLTFGLVWALLTLILWGAPSWAWALFGIVLVLRFAVAFVVGCKVLEDRPVGPSLLLIPLRDVIALALWVVSFAGHTVDWRGSSFTLRNGKLDRIQP